MFGYIAIFLLDEKCFFMQAIILFFLTKEEKQPLKVEFFQVDVEVITFLMVTEIIKIKV